MKRTITALGLATALVLSIAACGTASSGGNSTSKLEYPGEKALVLSDSKVTLDGQEVAEDSGDSVTISHDIVYYQAGMGEEYGEGTEADEHSADEADAHTVVTICEPGFYRVSGSLSAGQLAVDLGEDAKTDPEAVVTLVLDNVDITCSVAPAVIFYNVYECDTDWVDYDNEEIEDYQASPNADTSAAGANVIIADGSVNNIDGSYVARIYQEGTTQKLHKYDGAFYSKMSMNIGGETEGTGVLNITAANEGLDSELHLAINGGIINIQAQNDGINTNEDGVSVTTINGGTLQINAGMGVEGDGIDSNGYLVINGGNIYTMASDRSPDGGIDADGDILLNGGYVVALGVRNDAVTGDSAQEYMELSFASTLSAGSAIELTDTEGEALLSFTTEKAAQSLTFSSPDLAQDVAYTLKVNGVVQQYTGNSSGGFGGMGGGRGERPEGDFKTDDLPEGQEPPQRPDGELPQDGQRPERPEGFEGKELPEDFEGQEPPESFEDRPNGKGSKDNQSEIQTTSEGSVAFTLTDTIHAFSGISDSAQDSGKTELAFSAQVSVDESGAVSVTNIQPSEAVDSAHVQITITDVPSEDYAASCLLSDGDETLANILPTDPGTYQLTIAVAGDDTYTGTSQFTFTIPAHK